MKYKVFYPIEESEAESWERYARVLDLTMKLVGTAAQPVNSNICECWKAIASFWNSDAIHLCGKNYLREALYHIRFRRFSDKVHEHDEQMLVLLIEDEMLRCGYAFHAWVQMNELGQLYHEMLFVCKRDGARDEYPAMKLDFYLTASMMNRIMLKSRTPQEWGDTIDCNRMTYPYYAGCVHWYVKKYENAVAQLIPEADTWYEEWSDEQSIITAVKEKYAVDLTNDSSSFDALIRLVEERKAICHCSYELYQMKQFTTALAEGIWGERYEYMLQKCFLDIFSRYKISKKNTKRSKYSSEKLVDSWLYQWIDQKRMADELDPGLRDKISKAQFAIALNV